MHDTTSECVCVLLRRKTQTCDCPCPSATQAATRCSPWPKTTRTSSCPQTCSCQGKLKLLPPPNPPSPGGGTSPKQSELNLGDIYYLSPVVGKKNVCVLAKRRVIHQSNTDSRQCLGRRDMFISDKCTFTLLQYFLSVSFKSDVMAGIPGLFWIVLFTNRI